MGISHRENREDTFEQVVRLTQYVGRLSIIKSNRMIYPEVENKEAYQNLDQ